jgi:hypothetical protein
MAERRRQEMLEYTGYGIAFIFLMAFAGLLTWIVGAWWTGKL